MVRLSDNRKITIDGNEVKLEISIAQTEIYPEYRKIFEKKYEIVNLIHVSNHTFAECIGNLGEKDIYSLDKCVRIYQALRDDSITYTLVLDDVYVKVTHCKIQRIYDEFGSLIDISSTHDLDVVFLSTGACIRRTNRNTNVQSFWTFEGYKI